jgi:hypothetical protein
MKQVQDFQQDASILQSCPCGALDVKYRQVKVLSELENIDKEIPAREEPYNDMPFWEYPRREKVQPVVVYFTRRR